MVLSLGVAHPDFGRSVNPISTRKDKLCPPNNYWHTRIFRPSDGPDLLRTVAKFLFIFFRLEQDTVIKKIKWWIQESLIEHGFQVELLPCAKLDCTHPGTQMSSCAQDSTLHKKSLLDQFLSKWKFQKPKLNENFKTSVTQRDPHRAHNTATLLSNQIACGTVESQIIQTTIQITYQIYIIVSSQETQETKWLQESTHQS